jgi:2-polyprenyl-3-methyl-5-hydroxy-6-metoxy-1,4-benzoquinol methylase
MPSSTNNSPLPTSDAPASTRAASPALVRNDAPTLAGYYRDNLQLWDSRVQRHIETDFYGLEAFRKGQSSLTHIEREALADVRGKSLLHLQCHFGLDSLSWAREGARVTGFDFSPRSIAAARALNQELGLDARFVESDVYSLRDHVRERFDIVFTSYGVLKWLHDIRRWGQIVAESLSPGGVFFLVEFHPFLYVFDYERAEKIAHPYFFGSEPVSYDETGSYADMSAPAEAAQRVHSWPHPVSHVIQSLIDAGLRIDRHTEYPYSTINCFPFVREERPGRYVHRTYPNMVPILYSVMATLPREV